LSQPPRRPKSRCPRRFPPPSSPASWRRQDEPDRHLALNAGGRRLALVVNEFGELGVDRELLLGCGLSSCSDDDVIELSNGCICCTVADDFLPAVRKILRAIPPPTTS
jgi:hypothetical protein